MTHEELIERFFAQNGKLRTDPLSGGDINSVYRVVDGKEQHFVVKINTADDFPQMLEKEARGITSLRRNGIGLPEVLAAGELEGLQYLFMDYIPKGNPSPKFWGNFGTGLADLHRTSHPAFGWDEDNYIGSLHQSNRKHRTWTGFFVNERLIPQVKLARDADLIDRSERQLIEHFYGAVNELWPEESPALLHGDLWSGNFITGLSDTPYLIDPAPYYGHREMDLGMMHLFGGFHARLFEIYNAAFPLEKGWKERIRYNQLYPLLVHLNLFGRSYFSQIQGIVNRFS